MECKSGRQVFVCKATTLNARSVFGGWGGSDGLCEQRDVDHYGIRVQIRCRREDRPLVSEALKRDTTCVARFGRRPSS